MAEYLAGIPASRCAVASDGMNDAAGLRPESLRKRVWLVTRIIRLALMMAARVQIFVRVEKVGSRNVPRCGPVILAGNHPSPIDPILLFGGLRRNVCFLAAEFLFRQPVLGRLLGWMGHVRVERGTDKAQEAAAFGERVLAHDGMVVIFPGGRITGPGERYQPKTGVARMAFATGSPDRPVLSDRHRADLCRRSSPADAPGAHGLRRADCCDTAGEPDASRPCDSDQPRGQRQRPPGRRARHSR